MDLLVDACDGSYLLRADWIHHRCAAAVGFLGDSAATIFQLTAHEWFLFGRAAVSNSSIPAFSLFVAAVVGQHSGAASRFPGRANSGEGRSLVFDGLGAAALPLVARCAIAI